MKFGHRVNAAILDHCCLPANCARQGQRKQEKSLKEFCLIDEVPTV